MLWTGITNLAVMHKQMQIPEVYARTWFNEGKDLLATLYDTACKLQDVPMITAANNQSIQLPEKCVGVNKVKDSEDKIYRYVTADHTQITFAEAGNYTVTCLFPTDDYDGISQSPAIHNLYCPALALFIASRELRDLKPDKSQQLYNEFLGEAGQADVKIKRIYRGGNRQRPVPKFR